MFCRVLMAPMVLLAMTAAVQGAERPTAIEVRDAVERSRAEYRELHPPVSKAQAQRKVEEDVQRARDKLRQARRIRNPRQRVAALKKANDEIAALVDEASGIVRDYQPEDRNRLMPLKMSGVAVGAVGRLTEKNSKPDGIGYEHRVVRCVKVLDKTEMLAVIEHREADATDAGDSVPQPSESPKFLLKGIAASAAMEQQVLPGVYDVVVTGEQTYEDADGETRTVWVLEVFNPDQTFR